MLTNNVRPTFDCSTSGKTLEVLRNLILLSTTIQLIGGPIALRFMCGRAMLGDGELLDRVALKELDEILTKIAANAGLVLSHQSKPDSHSGSSLYVSMVVQPVWLSSPAHVDLSPATMEKAITDAERVAEALKKMGR